MTKSENLYFHVFNKSIANYGIFKRNKSCIRFLITLNYYNNPLVLIRLSQALKNKSNIDTNLLNSDGKRIIKILSYCIMPDHYHLLLGVNSKPLLSKYISDVENSYTRYFNIKSKRKGPLWQGRFKAVPIKNNEQLLHISRYIHLNPTTAFLVKKPEEWTFSSYNEIITDESLLKFKMKEFSITKAKMFKKFTENNIDYQRVIKTIRKKLID